MSGTTDLAGAPSPPHSSPSSLECPFCKIEIPFKQLPPSEFRDHLSKEHGIICRLDKIMERALEKYFPDIYLKTKDNLSENNLRVIATSATPSSSQASVIPGQQGGVDIPPTTDIGLIEPKQEPPDCTYPVVTPGGLLIPKAEPDFDCEVDSGPLAKPALADDLLQISGPTSLAQDVSKAPEALNTLDADTTEGNAEVKQEQADEISVEEFSLDNPDSAEFNFKRKRAAVDDLTQNTSGPSIKRPRPDIRSESAPILLENLDDSQVDSKEDVLRQAQLPPEPPEKKWYHGTEYRCQVCTGLFYKVNALILHVREWHARTIQDYKTEFGDLKTKQLEYTCQVCEKPVGHEQDIIEGHLLEEHSMERSIYEAIYEASESKPEEKSGKEAPETATSSEEGDMDTFPEDEFQPSESEEASEEDEEEEEEEGQLRRPKRSVKKRVEIIEDDSASEPENDEDDDWGSEEVGDDDDDDDVEESWEDEDDPDSDDSIRDRSKKQPSGGRRRQRQQLSPRSPSNSGLILPESIKSIKELKSVQIPLSRLDPKVIAEAIVRNCPECQESFKGLKALEEHVQTMHIKLEPQDCDHCKMRFLIPEAYQVIMSLGCNTCDRKDSDTHGVKIKEEPDEEVEDLHVKLNHHECQQCSAIFFAKPLLVKHMKTVHSQSQNSCGCEHFSHPQQCPLCTSFFLQRSLLMKHIQESHGTHTCKKCKKVFIYKHNFRK